MMSTPGSPADEAWLSVEVLAEPTRRRIYEAVRAGAGPVTRDDIARDVGIGRRLAAFHLDRLAEAGLLTVDYARPEGRGGPGAGRPAKRYAPAVVDVGVSVPPRSYNVVARILAEAVSSAPRRADEAALHAARREGERVGVLHRPPARSRRGPLACADAALHSLGYEPSRDSDRVRLRNCPFHDVVDIAPALVCGLNRELIAGVLDGLGVAGECHAHLDGVAPDCCVTVTTSETVSQP